MPRDGLAAAMLAAGSDEPFRATLYLMVLGVRPPAGLPRGLRPRHGAHRLAVHRADRHRLSAAQRGRLDPRPGRPHPACRDPCDHRGRAPDPQGPADQIAPTRATAAACWSDCRGGRSRICCINCAFVREVNDLLFQDVPREDFAVVAQFLRTFRQNSERATGRDAPRERERNARRQPRSDESAIELTTLAGLASDNAREGLTMISFKLFWDVWRLAAGCRRTAMA